jgi:hypothetical protein
MKNLNFMEKLEEQFNSQTAEQISNLIDKCEFYCKDNDMVRNIIRNIKNSKNISFNQWKALSAHLSKHNNPTKTI